MKNLKRFFSIVLAIAMIATLAACGGKSTGGAVDVDNVELGDDGVNYVGQTTATQRALFGDLKGTKIRIGVSNNVDDWEKNFMNQLEQTYGMKVETEVADSNEILAKVKLAVASGDTRNYFDVAIIANINLLSGVYGNLYIAMDDYIDRNDPVWKYSENTDFLAPDLYKVDGQIFGSPSHGYHENFIFYNKTYIVDECGAPDPYEDYYLKDNWTFETFRKTCEAISTDSMTAFGTWNIFSFASAAGNKFIEQDEDGRWEIVIDEPNGIEALRILHDAAKNGWTTPHDDGYKNFVARKTAMIIEKPASAMGSTDAYAKMTDEIGIVPMPKLNAEQEKYVCPLIASGYAITACSQNYGGAAAYIYHMRAAEQARDKSEWGKTHTARFLNEEHLKIRNEYLKVCEFDMPYADGLVNWWDGARTTILEKLMIDLVTPAAAVDSFIPLVKDCLRNTGAPC